MLDAIPEVPEWTMDAQDMWAVWMKEEADALARVKDKHARQMIQTAFMTAFGSASEYLKTTTVVEAYNLGAKEAQKELQDQLGGTDKLLAAAFSKNARQIADLTMQVGIHKGRLKNLNTHYSRVCGQLAESMDIVRAQDEVVGQLQTEVEMYRKQFGILTPAREVQ